MFLAITAAPSREQHIAIVRDANARIAARCTAMDGAHFVDASAAFFDSAGRPDPKWFVKDQLHLNADGYAEWARVVRPALERILAAR
jgi:lysophospholipase L1-like esterase